jgi:hypothetical protein
MTRTIITASLACALAASPVLAQPQYGGGNRPVMLKADNGLDPCSLGAITGADDGAIMVFPGDSTDLDATDFLSDGEKVWICDSDEGGDMIGIVYSADPDKDCEVGSPVAEDRPYLGPCEWGWIKAQWVQVLAG